MFYLYQNQGIDFDDVTAAIQRLGLPAPYFLRDPTAVYHDSPRLSGEKQSRTA